MIITKTYLHDLVLFYVRVFNDPSVDNLVFVCSKLPNDKAKNEKHQIKIHDIKSQDFDLEIRNTRLYYQNWIKSPDFIFEIDREIDSSVIEKLEKGSRSFGQIGKTYFGIQTFDRTKFVSKQKKNDYFKPVIDGTNILRYVMIPPSEYINYKPENIKSGGNLNVYGRERIVVRQIGKYPEGCLCPKELLTLNTVYNLYMTDNNFDIRFVLGLINSKTIQFYWLNRFYDNKETFPKIKKKPLESIPIKNVKQDLQLPIIKLVDRILTAKQRDPAADTRTLEAKIDRLVYALYGLTEEEIRIVEGVKS